MGTRMWLSEETNRRTQLSSIRFVATNAVLAVFWGFFCWSFIRAFIEHRRFQDLLFLTIESVIMIMFLARRTPKTQTKDVSSWLVAILGTVAPLFLRPSPLALSSIVAAALQTAGGFLGVLAVFALNRSFGIVPANRGIRTGGVYRYVRHPIYAAYITTYAGYVTSNPTSINIAIFFTCLGLFLARIALEEQHLTADPEYAQYCAHTRWRLVPFLF